MPSLTTPNGTSRYSAKNCSVVFRERQWKDKFSNEMHTKYQYFIVSLGNKNLVTSGFYQNLVDCVWDGMFDLFIQSALIDYKKSIAEKMPGGWK